MLRITRTVGDDSVDTLKLEGKLQGPWVDEAHDACAVSTARASRTCLDLSELTFADGEGAALLRELIPKRRPGRGVFFLYRRVAPAFRRELTSLMKPIRSDEQLIDAFLTGEKDDSETAFETLVKRHGPMVLGVCRQVLGQDQDAEDAFQATFFVLARKAGTVHNRAILGYWLYEVAHRTALRARARACRRRAIERQAMEMSSSRDGSGDRHELLSSSELPPVLHEEVVGLPEKYRIPVILAYLQGMTNREVAERLNWPIGTVKGRLSRAREALRARLSRRGLDSDAVRYRWG